MFDRFSSILRSHGSHIKILSLYKPIFTSKITNLCPTCFQSDSQEMSKSKQNQSNSRSGPRGVPRGIPGDPWMTKMFAQGEKGSLQGFKIIALGISTSIGTLLNSNQLWIEFTFDLLYEMFKIHGKSSTSLSKSPKCAHLC